MSYTPTTETDAQYIERIAPLLHCTHCNAPLCDVDESNTLCNTCADMQMIHGVADSTLYCAGCDRNVPEYLWDHSVGACYYCARQANRRI